MRVSTSCQPRTTSVNIRSATLVGTIVSPRSGFPGDPRPEAAFIGRSNVGKSSLINGLLRVKNLARTSNTPGKTRQVYYYLINERWLFVDLPGYGYARASRAEQVRWQGLVEGYLGKPKAPAVGLLLLDCRHRPTVADGQVRDWLEDRGLEYVAVLTKSDKLSRSRLLQAVREMKKGFLSGRDVPVVSFSARTGEGREDLWRELEARMP